MLPSLRRITSRNFDLMLMHFFYVRLKNSFQIWCNASSKSAIVVDCLWQFLKRHFLNVHHVKLCELPQKKFNVAKFGIFLSRRTTLNFLQENNISLLSHPSMSSDLNLIEHLWNMMQCHLRSSKTVGYGGLRRDIMSNLKRISQSDIKKCINIRSNCARWYGEEVAILLLKKISICTHIHMYTYICMCTNIYTHNMQNPTEQPPLGAHRYANADGILLKSEKKRSYFNLWYLVK